jgi:glycosidase
VLRFYRRLIALRRTNPSLHEGNFMLVNENDANARAFVREYEGQKVLVALNMTANPQAVSFGAWRKANTLLRSIKSPQKQVGLSPLTLAPFESFVGEDP